MLYHHGVERLNSDRETDPLPIFHPEFGRFMLEATPGKPWGIGFKDLLDVERNMKWRYVHSSSAIEEAELSAMIGGR